MPSLPSLPVPGPDQLVGPVSTLLGYLGKEATARRGRARRALDGASPEFWDAALAVYFAYAKLRALATVQTGPLLELVSFPQVLRKQDELWEAGRRVTVTYYNLRMTGRKQRVRAAEAITDALSVLGTGVADKPEAAWEQQGRKFADLLIAFAATPNRHWWQRW
jgi:hypothetical protein